MSPSNSRYSTSHCYNYSLIKTILIRNCFQHLWLHVQQTSYLFYNKIRPSYVIYLASSYLWLVMTKTCIIQNFVLSSSHKATIICLQDCFLSQSLVERFTNPTYEHVYSICSISMQHNRSSFSNKGLPKFLQNCVYFS